MEMLLNYSGPINFAIKKELVAEFRQKLHVHATEVVLIKRCVYILEELLSNTHEYYKTKDLSDENIQMKLGLKDDAELEMSISNTLDKKDSDRLRIELDFINKQPEEKLRKDFRQNLSYHTIGKFGGVGLITSRLQAGNQYTYTLDEKNAEQFVFTLHTSIKIHS
jgi:hypothetical protein